MAAIALTTSGRVEVLKSIDQTTARCGVAVSAGSTYYVDTSGNWAVANATNTTLSAGPHVALRSANKGEYATMLRTGDMDGYDLTSLAYNAPVYLQDTGGLGTTAGTTSVVLGRVRPANAAVPAGSAPDKVLRLHAPL